MAGQWIPVVHLVCTLLMAGVIIFVQVVHYPLMGRVSVESFVAYEAGHTFRTGFVVIPLMLGELGSALLLAAVPDASGSRVVAWIGLGLLAVVWLSTGLLQAPAHGRLSRGFDVEVHRCLVRTNWIRTIAWLARVPVAVVLLG